MERVLSVPWPSVLEALVDKIEAALHGRHLLFDQGSQHTIR